MVLKENFAESDVESVVTEHSGFLKAGLHSAEAALVLAEDEHCAAAAASVATEGVLTISVESAESLWKERNTNNRI